MIKQEYIAEWVLRAQKIAKLGIWDQDPISDELWWSEETFRLLGLDSQSVTPSFDNFLQMVHPDDRAIIVKQTKLALESDDNPYKVEYRVIWPDKSERIFHEEALIERNEKGTPIKITGIIQDITESKLAAKALREKESQLQQSQKMETIGILAGGIAHEFNNLLFVISGSAELLILDAKHDDKEILEAILESTQRGENLVKQLMTFCHKSKNNLQRTHLNTEIRQIKKMLVWVLSRKIDIRLDLVDNLQSIMADDEQIKQVVINLCLNARDAMPDGGELTIKTENSVIDELFIDMHQCKLKGLKVGKYVVLTISDTGCGMDKKIMEHLFEPFFTTKEVGKGTGLGLSVVYGIIENHDGHIFCDSKIGIGTTFKVYFPVIEDYRKI